MCVCVCVSLSLSLVYTTLTNLLHLHLQQHIKLTHTPPAEYPARVAFSLLSKTLEDCDATFVSGKPNYWRTCMVEEGLQWPALDASIEKYQNPAEADQISKIQKNLDDTREVLHNTIDSVLQRGEKLEDLVERSGELSSQSKLFYKQAKRANACCAVI